MKQIILLLFSWMLVLPAMAENTSTAYKITKEWKTDAGTEFELSARNQNFKVEIWDKDIIRIDFVLSSTTSGISEEDFKEGLKVSAEKTGNVLTVNTNLGDLNTGSIWSWIFNDKDSKEGYRTNNIIYLPRNLSSASFSMNYSELTIGEINMPLKIKSNYGIVSVEKNKNRTVLNTTYSDIKLGNLSHAKVGTSYCELAAVNIDTLNIASSYDDLKFTDCGLIQSLTMNYGDIIINKAGYAKATCTYSDLKINALTQGINAILTYSDLKVEDIARNFSGITVTGTYSDCSMKVNPEHPVNLNITDVNGSIALKNNVMMVTKKHETANTTSMAAKTKSATDASPTIKINSNNCDLTIY